MRQVILIATLLAALVVAAGGAGAAPPTPPAQALRSLDATLEAQRDALPAGRERRHLDRALQSLRWALADVHWTPGETLADGDGGVNALRDLRTTIARLTWIDPAVRDAHQQDVVALASVLQTIAHSRYDAVSRFLGGPGAGPLAPDVLADFSQRPVSASTDLRCA